MLLTSTTEPSRHAMANFLIAKGVPVLASDDFQAIGRLNSRGELMGVVGYNNFSGRVASMHVAGEGNWVSRRLLWFAFAYPFEQLKLRSIIAPVAADNSRALKLDKHLGFREVHRIKDGWADGIDYILLQLDREDCKWHKMRVRDENDYRMAA